MAVYLYGIASVKYGTSATGLGNFPSGVLLTTAPDTVKGSVTIEETEGATTEFFVDQKFSPVRSVKTEEGKLSATFQFYDMTFNTMAAFKGGTGNASGYTPATGYVTVDKALELTLDSGDKLCIHNASCATRIVGGGGRDKLWALEVKATPQMTTDLSGSWRIHKYGPVI
uniref:Uncharacterized protein n=1 Tax=viral metagenome TaxID=1070528 RepID=A0A6M3JSS3_9ZZZZ